MKKIIASVLMLGFAAAVYADDKPEETKFTLGATGNFYAANYHSAVKDENGSYAALRMRPLLDIQKGGLEAVLKLEYDAQFGAYPGDGKSSETVGLGADKKGIEVANAFFKNTFTSFPGLSVVAGIAPYDYPIVWGDNAPLVGASYTSGNLTLNLNYIKVSSKAPEGTEGLTDSDGNTVDNAKTGDSQIYAIDASIKSGDMSFRPGIFLFQSGKNASADAGAKYRDSIGGIYALNTSLVFGALGFDATGAYISGKDKVSDIKYSAYAFDLAPSYKVSDSVKFTGFFTMMSGDSNDSDDKENSFLGSTIDGGGAGINIWRLYIIEDGGTFTTRSDVANAGKYGNANGYMAAGLTLDASFGAITTKLQGAWVQAAKVASGQKKDIGVEFDANIGYGIATGTTLYVEGAFLKAGKFYGDSKQNAYYANLGMTYAL